MDSSSNSLIETSSDDQLDDKKRVDFIEASPEVVEVKDDDGLLVKKMEALLLKQVEATNDEKEEDKQPEKKTEEEILAELNDEIATSRAHRPHPGYLDPKLAAAIDDYIEQLRATNRARRAESRPPLPECERKHQRNAGNDPTYSSTPVFVGAQQWANCDNDNPLYGKLEERMREHRAVIEAFSSDKNKEKKNQAKTTVE